MPAKNTKKGAVPTLCVRRSPSSGRSIAYSTFNGRQVSFGPDGPDARRRFDEFLAAWIARGRRLEHDTGANGDDVYRVEDHLGDYLIHARAYYVDPTTKQPSGEPRVPLGREDAADPGRRRRRAEDARRVEGRQDRGPRVEAHAADR